MIERLVMQTLAEKKSGEFATEWEFSFVVSRCRRNEIECDFPNRRLARMSGHWKCPNWGIRKGARGRKSKLCGRESSSRIAPRRARCSGTVADKSEKGIEVSLYSTPPN
jgi:hypothetical protein